MTSLVDLALALLAATPIGREGAAPILDPRTYSSPSGRYSLYVDPSSRYGSGPSHCTLTLDDRERRSFDLPYTFWGAAVDDSGVIAGYAFTLGPQGLGQFVIALSGPEAVDVLELFNEPRAMVGNFYKRGPSAHGLLFDPDADRLIVRMAKEKSLPGEEWHVWQISTREPCPTIEPRVPDAKDAPYFSDAVHVPGTPLQLVQWWPRPREMRFGLMPLNGELAAAVDPEFEAKLEGDFNAITRWKRRQESIATCAKPRSFELVSVKQQARVRFEAIQDADTGAWSIRETARGACSVSIEPAALAKPELDRVALPLIAEVRLGKGADPAGLGALTSIATVAVNARRELLALDRRTHAVHVFASDGSHLRVFAPDPGDDIRTDEVVALPNGGALVPVHLARWLEFDGDGRRIGLSGAPMQPDAGAATQREAPGEVPRRSVGRERIGVSRTRIALPDGREWSRAAEHSFALTSPEGAEIRRVERRGDGAWFRGFEQFASAPDGTLCTVDAGVVTVHRSLAEREVTYDAPFSGRGLVYTGRWIAAPGDDGSLVVMDARDGSARRMELDQPSGDRTQWSVLSPPGSGELWLVEAASRTLRRYALLN